VLRDGDILLNEGHSRELVGRSAIFRGEVRGACFQTLVRFRLAPSNLSAFAQRYFQYCLNSGTFAAIAKQTTSIAHLGAQSLADHPDLGRVVPEFGQTFLSELVHPPFRIVYRREPDAVRIVRVWRGERRLRLPDD